MQSQQKKQDDSSESSESDSDLGLPPPVPSSSAASKFLPKLRIGGLGLSTLAKNDGGRTAEEESDLKILNNTMKPSKVPEASDSSESSRSQK